MTWDERANGKDSSRRFPPFTQPTDTGNGATDLRYGDTAR